VTLEGHFAVSNLSYFHTTGNTACVKSDMFTQGINIKHQKGCAVPFQDETPLFSYTLGYIFSGSVVLGGGMSITANRAYLYMTVQLVPCPLRAVK